MDLRRARKEKEIVDFTERKLVIYNEISYLFESDYYTSAIIGIQKNRITIMLDEFPLFNRMEIVYNEYGLTFNVKISESFIIKSKNVIYEADLEVITDIYGGIVKILNEIFDFSRVKKEK